MKGHAYFLQNGVNNKLSNNLAVNVQASDLLRKTDQNPSAFWITNPDNILSSNAAAGSDSYGFFLEFRKHSIGASAIASLNPSKANLGSFSQSSAHGIGGHGLYIPSYTPTEAATFYSFNAWNCGENGAYVDEAGKITFTGFMASNNGFANIEFSRVVSDPTQGIIARLEDSIVLGNTGFLGQDARIQGVVTPRTEWFALNRVKFFNFTGSNAAAIVTCSGCLDPQTADSGAPTVTVSNLTFDDDSSVKRVRFQLPQSGIIEDLDGSFTNFGSNSWATPYSLHNDWPECVQSETQHSGLICDNTVQVRRLAFYGALPEG